MSPNVAEERSAARCSDAEGSSGEGERDGALGGRMPCARSASLLLEETQDGRLDAHSRESTGSADRHY